MTSPFPRVIQVVHALRGRLRLRLPWLHDERDAAAPIADRLATVDGIVEVQVRAHTGSVLCLYDPHRTDEARIIDVVREATGIDRVHRAGDQLPADLVVAVDEAVARGSDVARAAAVLFKGLNADILAATEGRLDLGTLAALTFAAAGFTEVAVTGKLPLPPWSQLAWWAFRTFTTLEQSAIESSPYPGTRGSGARDRE